MKAEIFVKDNCPYCTRAKRLFEKENISYEEVDAVENRQFLIDRVTEETGVPPKSVPQIWIDGEFVGGYEQLVKWLEDVN